MVGRGTERGGRAWQPRRCDAGRAWRCLLVVLLLGGSAMAEAQEMLRPLQRGVALPHRGLKSGTEAVALPFFDDFAAPTAWPTEALWERGGVRTNGGKGLKPPTVGVATLDAMGPDGNLYEGAGTGLFPADTLMSARLQLSGHTVGDSVVVSFYYLPGGGKGNRWETIGDAPDANDSLFLDFYREVDSTWVTVWSRGGISVDSLVAQTGRDWQYVALALDDTAYFTDAFRFRFRNLCSETATNKAGLAGNCDYWHLDYVLVDAGRGTTGDPEFRDVAFVEPAPSMLKDFQAMPARQYRASDMAQHLEMTITNLYSSTLATQYGYAIVDEGGDTVERYDGGYENAPAFLPTMGYQQSQAHAQPAVAYAFPEGEEQRSYTVVHTVREGVGGDVHTMNDTVRFTQEFGDYYAYDDGTAEDGYGLTSTASRLFLAYKFDLNVADTLTVVEMCFNPTVNGENERVPFYVTVWADRDGKPGEVLYKDSHTRFPAPEGVDRFQRLVLDEAVALEAGTVYIGFEQGNNYFINLGFDRNRDTRERIFYLTGTTWQQSILRGSLMIRPHFGMAATVGVERPERELATCRLMPNPASQQVEIEGLPEGSLKRIYDMTGRLMVETTESTIATAAWAEGVYVVRWTSGRQGASGIEKLIIKH